jgi:hypothetical protein
MAKPSKRNKTSRKPNQKKRGCAPSFLTQKRNELDEVCPPDPKEEYVQPDAEKEAGGEG